MRISQYDGANSSYSRVSPAIHGSDLILGDIVSPSLPHDGARIMAVDRQHGNLHWVTQVEKNPAATITGSPVVVGDMVVVGVSSRFRGSMVALDANTGKVLWQTYTVPDNGGKPGGYSGGAIWQPSAVDSASGLIYVGTGNNYSVPDAVQSCQAKIGTGMSTPCTDANDYFDSLVAINLKTGSIAWARHLHGYDVWTVACGSNKDGVTCPTPAGPGLRPERLRPQPAQRPSASGRRAAYSGN